MKKDKTIEELNNKLNKLKIFHKTGVPLCNKIFFAILGVTFVTMLLSTFSSAALIAYIAMLGTTLVSGIINGVVQFTDYEKKIDRLTNEIDKKREMENNNTTKLQEELKQELNVENNVNKGYSRTKAMKVYVEKVNEANKAENENDLELR